jgi:hypothetical protein
MACRYIDVARRGKRIVDSSVMMKKVGEDGGNEDDEGK